MPSSQFYSKLNQVADNLDMNPRDLLLVMYLESGVSASAINKGSGAAGLIQFAPDTLKTMGLSKQDVQDFSNKSDIDQLNYVQKYIQGKQGIMGGKPFTSATQYYHANFFPKTLSRWSGDNPYTNQNVVVAASNASDPRERAAYQANYGVLDYNKDGKITVGDLMNVLDKKANESGFQNMLSNLNQVAGDGTVSEFSKPDNDQKPPTTPNQTSSSNNLYSVLDQYLSSLIGTANQANKSLIVLAANDIDEVSKIEFSNILAVALKEELNIDSDIYKNNDNIEIECKSNDIVKLKSLCFSISDAFKDATYKLGNIKINSFIIQNKSSNGILLEENEKEINYRKFKYKLIGK